MGAARRLRPVSVCPGLEGNLCMDSKAMGIKRLDHVAWVVNKLEDALPLLTNLMGMTVEGRFENPEVGFRGVGLRVPGGTGHFELLEPYDENSYLHKFIEEKGPGLHHVTFEVEDAHAAAKAMKPFPFPKTNRPEHRVSRRCMSTERKTTLTTNPQPLKALIGH